MQSTYTLGKRSMLWWFKITDRYKVIDREKGRFDSEAERKRFIERLSREGYQWTSTGKLTKRYR